MTTDNANIKKSDTFERILDAAEEFFAKKGYPGTSTREIAKAAGISLQTLHYHCGGKPNLYKTVLNRAIAPTIEMLNKRVGEMLSKNLGDDQILRDETGRIIDELFDLLYEHPNYPLLFYRQWLEQNGDIQDNFRVNILPTFQGWAAQVEKSIGKERVSGVNLLLLLHSLGWMFWGMMVQPAFLGILLEMSPDSPYFLQGLKSQAKELTARIFLASEKNSTAFNVVNSKII